MPETKIIKQVPRWIHISTQLVVAGLLIYWYWHAPAPNKAVLWLGGVAAIMALFEPARRLVYFFLIIGLMYTENRAIDKDRTDFAQKQASLREEQNQEFREIAEGIKRAIDAEKEHFDRTMAGFEAQKITLAQLHQQDTRLEQKMADLPLADMPSQQVAENARAIAEQMRDYQRIYRYRDSQLATSYFDRLEGQGWKMTANERRQWIDEGGKKRADLTSEYEADVKKTISQANRVRLEMVSRLFPSDRSPEDAARANWFEHPTSDKTLSVLDKLDENAKYLDDLARRITCHGN